jgi:predicted  nucleic acid-binding Zn-ribbon protein
MINFIPIINTILLTLSGFLIYKKLESIDYHIHEDTNISKNTQSKVETINTKVEIINTKVDDTYDMIKTVESKLEDTTNKLENTNNKFDDQHEMITNLNTIIQTEFSDDVSLEHSITYIFQYLFINKKEKANIFLQKWNEIFPEYTIEH